MENVVKKYKELIFTEDSPGEMYQISIMRNGKIKEDVALMLLDCKGTVLDDGFVCNYDVGVSYNEIPSPIFATEYYDDQDKVFDDEELLEVIRISIIAVDNSLHCENIPSKVWVYKK